MPRIKKPKWERVTLTISTECATALRVLAAFHGQEMGEFADRKMREGGLLERMDHLFTVREEAAKQDVVIAPEAKKL